MTDLDLLARIPSRSASREHRRSASADHRGADAAVIDLVHRAAVLDLTDGRATASAASAPAPPALVQHAVAIEVPDAEAIEALIVRWLTGPERAAAAAKGDRARPGHVLGRVAAKQAVQAHLDWLGLAPVEAARIEITNAANGRPVVRVRGARVATRHLAVSIAHGRGAAVASATTSTAATPGPSGGSGSSGTGIGIGIDIEAIEPRSTRFEGLTLAPAERDLVPLAGDDRDTWLTRLWSAKEAAAKAAGSGLQGRPKDFAVDRVVGAHLRIGDRWIATERVTFAGVAHIVATTENHRTECAWHRS